MNSGLTETEGFRFPRYVAAGLSLRPIPKWHGETAFMDWWNCRILNPQAVQGRKPMESEGVKRKLTTILAADAIAPDDQPP